MTLANNLDECHQKTLAILKHCCAKHMDDAAFENMVYAVNFQITRAWTLGTTDCLTNNVLPAKPKK